LRPVGGIIPESFAKTPEGDAVDRDTLDSTIRTFRHRTPFRPFTVALVNGDRLEVDHPDAIVVREGVGLFVGPAASRWCSTTRGQPGDRGLGRTTSE